MYEQVTEHDIYKVGFLMVLSRRVANTGQAELCLVLAHSLVEFRLAFVAHSTWSKVTDNNVPMQAEAREPKISQVFPDRTLFHTQLHNVLGMIQNTESNARNIWLFYV